jgi:hypothetical protein
MNITQLLTDADTTYDFGVMSPDRSFEKSPSHILSSSSFESSSIENTPPHSPISLASDSYSPYAQASPKSMESVLEDSDLPLRVSRDNQSEDEALGLEIIVDQDQERWLTVNQLALRLERTQNNIKRSLANQGIFTRKASRRELKCLSGQLLNSQIVGKKTRSLNLVHYGSVEPYLRKQVSKLDKKKKGYTFFNKFTLTKSPSASQGPSISLSLSAEDSKFFASQR